ncbi:hypothetical protein SPHINGO8AM_170077 [Sphingomonas sp. 8AM]|nr:hypothetical protein SPHINGO8AM_170077 [Sphingomonas sp. 8AM]
MTRIPRKNSLFDVAGHVFGRGWLLQIDVPP